MTEVADNISYQDKADTQTHEDFTSILSDIDPAGLTRDNLFVELGKTLSRMATRFEADHAYIMLADDEGTLRRQASTNSGDHEEGLVTASNALLEKVVADAGALVVNDAMNSDEFAGDPDFQRFNITTVLCAPIKASDEPLGVLYLDSVSEKPWSRENVELLEFAGRHIGLVLENLRVQESLNKNRGLIAAGKATLNLSHSVKNILQMISGAAEVVDFGLRTNQIHRVKRSWDILKPNLERMRKYTLELLDYSKERKLNLGQCDFNRVIQGAIESLKSQLKQKNSKINIRIDQKMPMMDLDSERIHEMALNIILNAIDIVDDSGGLVSVETKYHAEEKLVSLAVTDNGPGISEEMKEKIFTPFESEKKKFGTGLGMPIAKQVIDQHGGRIDIDSLPSRGTTFTIYLPAHELTDSQQA